MTQDEQKPPAVIEYAPPPPAVPWARYFIRSAIVVSGFLLLAFGLKAVWPWITQAQYLYTQSRCLYYQAPPNQVVYDDDGEWAKANDSGNWKMVPFQRGEGGSRMGPRIPWPYVRVPKPAPFVLSFFNRGLQGKLTQLFFVGRLTSGVGERLVRIGATVPHGGLLYGRQDLEIIADGMSLATWKPGSLLTPGPFTSLTVDLSANDDLLIYAGQSVPEDPSKLTIRYSLNSVEGTIGVQLMKDGTVTIQVMDGPLISHIRSAGAATSRPRAATLPAGT